MARSVDPASVGVRVVGLPHGAAVCAAQGQITTPRLTLTANDLDLAFEVAAFQRRNREHFARWDPPKGDDFFSDGGQIERVAADMAAFEQGLAFRYWLRLRGPEGASPRGGQVIGHIHFNQVFRGAFHSAVLAYAMDAAFEGQGLMREALQAGLAEMFSQRVNLHRVQAAYRPENTRSGALLQRLGFTHIGVSPRYLYIDGAWRDHVLVSRVNEGFKPPSDWLQAGA